MALLLAAPVHGQEPRGHAVRDTAGELACGPLAAIVRPAAAVRILGGEEPGRAQFAGGDRVVINAGRAQGLEPGQEFFIRRVVLDRAAGRLAGLQPTSIHTAGWLKVVEVQADRATATITRACDSIHDGDYLDPFALPVVPEQVAAGEPDFANPARVVMADEGRHLGASGRLMVLDRGTEHGLRPGQPLTIFRSTPGGSVLRIGLATTMAVRSGTATIRIEETRDAVYVGDLVAVHRVK
jgi:hypothetical protein